MSVRERADRSSVNQLWRQVLAEFPDDQAAREARYVALLLANGRNGRGELVDEHGISEMDYQNEWAHRAFAMHAKGETCPECKVVKCIHCGTWGFAGDDHTCPCPFRDGECPDHG